MKIEILPENVKSSKKDEGGSSFGWIFDTVLGSVKTFLDEVSKSIGNSIDEVVSRTVKRTFMVLLVILGFIYMLNGFAEVLNLLYGVRGIGELLVGLVVLGTGCFLSIVWKK